MSRGAGRISGVVSWSGDVELEGECVIESGAFLILNAGCRVAAPAGAQPPRFIVEGTLLAQGLPLRPVRLNASVAAAGGWVLLSRCRLDGRGGEGLHLYGDGHRLERVAVAGFETGVFVRDGETTARRLSISGCATPFAVGAGGRLRWDGGGVSASGGSTPRVLVQGELIARGAPGRALTLDASIAAAGGRVELSRCRLNGRGGEGLNLYGAGHRLDRVLLSGFDTGLTLREGEATARDLTIAGGSSPVVVGSGGKLLWESGGASGGGPGRPLILVQGELVARGTPERALTLAASLAADGGRIELANCRLEGQGGEGLTLRGGGHLLEGVTLTGFECALAVRDGAAQARDLTISGERAGLEIGEGGSLSWEGGGISASGPERAHIIVKGGLSARGEPRRPLRLDASLSLEGGSVLLSSFLLVGGDGSELALDALTIAGCGAGSASAREGRLTWAVAGAPAGPAVITVEGEFVARGAGRPFILDASLATDGGRVELANCRLEGRGGEGLTLRGGGHLLEGVTLAGFECALAVRAGAAQARGLTISGERSGLEIGAGGRLNWEGGEISTSGPELPLILVQGEFVARDLMITGERTGLEISEGGSLSWESGGISASGPAQARIIVKGGLSASGGPKRALRLDAGLSLEGGSVRLSSFRLIGADDSELALDALTIAGCGAGSASAREGRLSWAGAEGSAVITVEGEFVARGAGRPFILDASLAADGGRIELANCRLEGQGGEGLTLRGGGHLLEGVTLTGFECALAVRDGAAQARDLTISGERAGLEIGEGGSLSWEGGAISASGPERPLIVVRGELVARGTPGHALTLWASLTTEGGRIELADCRLEGRGGEGLTLRGNGHRLERVTLTGFSCGLSLRAGEAKARELTVVRSEAAVIIGRAGRLVWEGGGARDGGTGALVSGGQALLHALRFRSLRQGVRVEDGAAEIDDLLCLDLSGPGVELHGTGYASLRGGRAPGGQALAVASGHAHLAGPYEGGVRVSMSARLCVSPESVSLEALGALRGFVVRTGSRPYLGRAYKAAAAASIRLFASWARRQPGVVGAWVHRSWVAGGWEPGASDIDLVLSVRELSSARARKWLARTQFIHASARRLFPALGELLIAEETEWRETAANGLPRPGEWRAQARVLTGHLPELPDAAPVNARLGARLEAAMAYSRLMDVCFHPEMAEELARREAAKATVDFLRYRSAEGERGRALPREEFRAGLSSSSPEWSERLRALAAPGRAHRAACSLAAAAARSWGGSELERGPVPRAEATFASGDAAALRRALETVDGARRDFDGAVSAAVFDTLHRSYLIVEPDCPEAVLSEGIAAWARRTAVCGTRPALPIVLTRRGWTLWRGTAYQDFPSASAAWPRSGDSPLESAGRAFPGEHRVFWGNYHSPSPSAEDAAAALAQARAQIRVVRRLHVQEARVSRAAAHQLLSRAACLALAARGLPAPDFDLDAALAALESFAPRAAAGLRRAASSDWTGFEAAAEDLLPATKNPEILLRQ